MAGPAPTASRGLDPPFELVPGIGGPLFLSVPHSGRNYPAWLVERSRLGQKSLETLEDPLVDQLVQRAIDRGAGAIIARAPRALIDLNRDPAELDPRAIIGRTGPAPTARAGAGLGLIPTRLAGTGDLWRGAIDEGDLVQRLAKVHRPYHDAIATRLSDLSRAHRQLVLLDCHSMPPRPRHEANVVLGNRHGTSAADWVLDLIEAVASRSGFSVARNRPFAGGHVVERHGRPRQGVHAVQIEIDRSAYCQRDMRTAGPGFDRVVRLFETLCETLIVHLKDEVAEAAE